MKNNDMKACITHAGVLFPVFFYAACFVWTGMLQNEPEELWHSVYLTWSDSARAAAHTYMAVNPRLGEMAFYFVGSRIRLWMLLLNPAMLTLALLCMYRLGVGRCPDRSMRSFCTLLFIALALLAFHSGVSWFLANFNWLYPCTLTLLFFCMGEPFFKGEFRIGAPRAVALSLLALVVGMSNQNTSLVSLMFFAAAGVYWKLRFKKRWGWPYRIILVLMLIGVGVFFGAPAHGARADMAGWELSFNNILYHSVLTPATWGYFLISFCRLLAMGAVLAVWRHRGNRIWKMPRHALLFSAFLALWGVLMLAPAWGAPRAYCPMDLVLTALLAGVFYRKAGMAPLGVSGFAVLAVHAALMLSWIIPLIRMDCHRYKVWRHIEGMAAEAKAQGKDVLVIRPADVDVHERPLGRFCSMPHAIIPYKNTVGYLAIPYAGEERYDYIRVTDAQQRLGNSNYVVAKRLGLKGLIWEKTLQK